MTKKQLLFGLLVLIGILIGVSPLLQQPDRALATEVDESYETLLQTDSHDLDNNDNKENFSAIVTPPAPVLPEEAFGSDGADSDTNLFLPFLSNYQFSIDLSSTWPMAGANPQRSSWNLEEVRGSLDPIWYRPIEPFIPHRVQIVAAHDTLYLSTARGLYAFNAENGAEKWVYPTELPLGHSPTIDGGIAYVGGFDHKIHAINAITGEGLWTFEAGSGFDTNPLVVGDKLYAGNRDGFFYAVYTQGVDTGKLAWKFQTQGPIHFSAAYQDNVVFFASNDSYAYALNAQTGQLVWKSAKLPGSGFHSWWPVVFENYVIFAGGNNYRFGSDLGPGPQAHIERDDVYPNAVSDPRGTLVGQLGTAPGNWVANTPTIDMSNPSPSTQAVTEYLETKPWRRTYFVLNRFTGEEYTTDFDNDGKPEYAPILWFGVDGNGNRYPPIVGKDGILYQTNNYMSDPVIAGGQISGWQLGSPFISVITSDWGAIDEPHAYAGGGDLIYWNLCCDRQSGSMDINIPNTKFAERYNNGILPPTGPLTKGREYKFGFGESSTPGYDVGYYGSDGSSYASFGGKNGIYGYHGDQNPPIPYKGKIYMHRSNGLIAFGAPGSTATALPIAETLPAVSEVTPVTEVELIERLVAEVGKIIDAGHLRPGYMSSGVFDLRARFDCGDFLVDYWHYPGDIHYTLLRALPYLPSDLQDETRDYLQEEFAAYPPYKYNHIGWQDGSAREIFDLPPETLVDIANYSPEEANYNYEAWSFAPHSFYALWKYALEFGDAKGIFDTAKNKLPALPSEATLLEMPHAQNAFIAGYLGYLELQQLAGYTPSADVQADLDYLLLLRVENFTPDTSEAFFEVPTKYYCRTLNASRNFMYLVPELAEILRDDPVAFPKVQAAIAEYETIAPYWFVSKAEMVFAEGILTPLQDYHGLFQAKALILEESQDELTKYLDVPAFPVGDLFYIDNLIAAIEAGSP